MSFLQCPASAQAPLNPIVILVDASHSPHFATGDASNGLKLLLDMVNASTRYIVRINTGSPLNDTVLQGADVLVIASPGSSFSSSEAASIVRMLNNGSSLMILGDPAISQNSTYWSESSLQSLGNNLVINGLLDKMNITGVRFSINSTGGGTSYGDTLFDYTHAVNNSYPWVIQMDPTTWQTNNPIFKDINELVLMTATLKPLSLPSSLARGYKTSFAQFRKGPNTWGNISFPNMTLEEQNKWPLNYSAINGTLPPWLSAFEYNGSRIVISGSTIMFTGRTIDIPKATSKWYYMTDNARLFMNMLSWLTAGRITPDSAVLPMLAVSCAFFGIGIIVYVFRKGKQ
jgi:hypothetical protein